jgi:coatomer subunit beta
LLTLSLLFIFYFQGNKIMAAAERSASIIINWEPSGTVNTNELKRLLMEKEIDSKVAAMKQIVSMMVNGENLNSMFMPVTQFAGPARDNSLKKLLLLYYEVIDKRGPDGRLKQEMIMVW